MTQYLPHKIPFHSYLDDTKVMIQPVVGSVSHFKRHRCWNIACRNFLEVVYFTKSNRAHHGYCHSCYERHILNEVLYNFKKTGVWKYVFKGKLVEAKDKERFLKRLKQRLKKN